VGIKIFGGSGGLIGFRRGLEGGLKGLSLLFMQNADDVSGPWSRQGDQHQFKGADGRIFRRPLQPFRGVATGRLFLRILNVIQTHWRGNSLAGVSTSIGTWLVGCIGNQGHRRLSVTGRGSDETSKQTVGPLLRRISSRLDTARERAAFRRGA